jgi:hypothetical protein
MSSTRLRTLKCPLCAKLLETDLPDGATLPCPHCDDRFVVAPDQVQAPQSQFKEGFYRLLIPIGYVAFFVVPIGAIVYYVSTRDKDEPKEQARANTDERTEKAPPRRIEPPEAPPKPRPKKKGPPAPRPMPVEDGGGLPEAPFPHEPVAEAVVLEVAPAPHDAIEVAPEPRAIYWKIPASAYSSKWETVGVVEVRLAQVVIAKYPVLDPATGTVTQSRSTALIIVVEARLRDAKKTRTHHSWTQGTNHYKEMFLEGSNKVLHPRELPAGTALNTGFVFPAPLPADGSSVRDVLIFEVPPADTQILELRLEAERVRESGNFWFKIPAEAWKK